jgi:hypothetical protein
MLPTNGKNSTSSSQTVFDRFRVFLAGEDHPDHAVDPEHQDHPLFTERRHSSKSARMSSASIGVPAPPSPSTTLANSAALRALSSITFSSIVAEETSR